MFGLLRPRRLGRLPAEAAACRAGGGEEFHDQHERGGPGNEQQASPRRWFTVKSLARAGTRGAEA
jgi:hypothetical protein